MAELSSIDGSIIIAYLAAMVGLGAWLARRFLRQVRSLLESPRDPSQGPESSRE